MVTAMKTSLDYRKDFLCVLAESEAPDGLLIREWYPVHPAEEVEARLLVGRAVTATDPDEAIYVDEEGNVFQLLDKGETKPIDVEHLPGREKTGLEVLSEASLKGGKTHKQNGDSRRMQRKIGNNGGKLQALQIDGS